MISLTSWIKIKWVDCHAEFTVSKKYAVAMFELAQEENKLVEYGEQLAEISTLFKTQPELKAFMSNPQIQPSAKKELLNKVFGSDIENQCIILCYY